MAEDNVLYAQSMENQEISTPMIDKTVQYITDLNNGSYGSGQVLIDSSSLSNSGRWCAYSDSYMEVPLVAALYPSATVTNFITANKNFNFSAGLKNGTIQLLHSLSVELNNANVVQLTPYTNFYLNYKLLTTLSQDDLHKMGHTICFWPDTSDSFSFSLAASADGLGSCNNKSFGWQALYPSFGGRIFTTATVAAGASPVTVSQCDAGTAIDCLYTTNYPTTDKTTLSTGNYGLYQRTKVWGSYSVDSTNYTALISADNVKTLWKNYFENSTIGLGAKVWYMLAHIKLRHVSDLFQQIPMSRGLYFRIIANFNVGTATMTPTAVAAVAGATGAGGYDTSLYGSPKSTKWSVSAPTLTNGTFPLIFASSNPGEPNYFLDQAAQATWYLGCGIASYTTKNSSATTYAHQSRNVRLYVPTYTMSAQAESAYLEMNGGTKTVIYEDILQYNIQNIISGQNVNQLITNGVVSPVKVLIVPIFSAVAADGQSQVFIPSPHQSPFATEPGTTSPLAAITNLNCLVSGQTIFQLNEQYDFQNFVDELSHSGLNAGETDGLSSGLISEYDWSNQFRYYLINIERRVAGADSVVPKSIQLLFQNLSARSVDYYVFVVVRRSFSINLVNGSLIA
jgi:hypothetical protein